MKYNVIEVKLQWWTCFIVYVWQYLKYSPSRPRPNMNRGLCFIIMHQCKSITCDKCTQVVWDVGSIGGCVESVWQDIWEPKAIFWQSLWKERKMTHLWVGEGRMNVEEAAECTCVNRYRVWSQMTTENWDEIYFWFQAMCSSLRNLWYLNCRDTGMQFFMGVIHLGTCCRQSY